MSESSPFAELSFSEKQLVYRGLLGLVESNSGYGFTNNDQGHISYAVGRNGSVDYERFGDSPDRNRLFRLMHALSVELSASEIDGTSEIGTYVFAWADFCSIAYSAYTQANEGG